MCARTLTTGPEKQEILQMSGQKFHLNGNSDKESASQIFLFLRGGGEMAQFRVETEELRSNLESILD